MGKTTSLDEARSRSANAAPAVNGPAEDAKAEKTEKKHKRGIKFFLVGAGAILVTLTFITQGQRMIELRAEEEALKNRILELENDTQRLKRKIQYSQTDAYIEQMALKQFGMIKPGDILFFADPNAGGLITAPVPAAPPSEAADSDAEPGDAEPGDDAPGGSEPSPASDGN